MSKYLEQNLLNLDGYNFDNPKNNPCNLSVLCGI